MAWTTAEEFIEAWIGDDAPSDTAKIDLWIGKAEREIRAQVPDIQVRLDAEAELLPPVTSLLDLVKDVVIAMVARVFRNPEGLRTRNTMVVTGPFTDNGSVTYGGDLPGSLYLSGDELAKLEGKVSRGAFTIDLMPATSRFSSEYVGWYPWL